MDQKARQNVAAAKLLLDAALVDSSMSRLYYALFQACVHVFIRRGLHPADLGPYTDWKHSTAKNHVYRARGRHADTAMFVEAYSLRLQADYRPQLVRTRDVAKLLPRVEDFVEEVCA